MAAAKKAAAPNPSSPSASTKDADEAAKAAAEKEAAEKAAAEAAEKEAAEKAAAEAAEKSKPTTDGRRLATYVHVGGDVYGPDDDVPDEVAEQITNPKAWAVEAPAEDS